LRGSLFLTGINAGLSRIENNLLGEQYCTGSNAAPGSGCLLGPREEAPVDSFLHEKYVELLRRRLAESDPTKDRARHNMLLRLLAEEEAKEKKAL
jgi:hypothetical protein